MRQIVLDTETTGLDWRNGDRIIEIGCVELLNRRLSGRHYHVFVNPEREVNDEAVAVHGITTEFLTDKPLFADIAAEFEDFVRDAELIIHNASFDVGFLDFELKRIARPTLDCVCSGVIDTLRLAKELNPGKKASLDALCERYQVDNGKRTLHGALLDAEILADVYLAMTRGQESLMMALEDERDHGSGKSRRVLADRPPLKIVEPTAEEWAAHEQVLDEVAAAAGGKCLWRPAAQEDVTE